MVQALHAAARLGKEVCALTDVELRALLQAPRQVAGLPERNGSLVNAVESGLQTASFSRLTERSQSAIWFQLGRLWVANPFALAQCPPGRVLATARSRRRACAPARCPPGLCCRSAPTRAAQRRKRLVTPMSEWLPIDQFGEQLAAAITAAEAFIRPRIAALPVSSRAAPLGHRHESI